MKQLIFLISTLIFTLVFYNLDLGLNVIIYNLTCFIGLLILKQLSFPTRLSKLIFISVITSTIFVVYHNTTSAIILHILNWIVFIGVLNYKKAKAISTWIYIGIINTALGISLSLKSFFFIKKSSSNKTRPKLSLYFIPIGIILMFLFIYRIANPVFDDFIVQITNVIFRPFKYLNLNYFPVFVFGLLLTSPIFFKYQHPNKELKDQNAPDVLKRNRLKAKRKFKIKGLTNEYHAGLFLLVCLNILLAIVNLFDIYTVWINFEFEGQTLKTFVHEGTYMLIVSILISMGILLYFFRKNLNFYKLNSRLKTLSYYWILQNIVLSISVFVRCYHYINNFGLAYKRIGVIIFILAVIVGLITVYFKVKHTKTINYLLRVNTISVFILLNSLTFFNWDVIIAKYNLSNYKESYVHFSFLSELSDNALFALQVTPNQLDHIIQFQNHKFPFYNESDIKSIQQNMYQEKIDRRIESFKDQWENKHWLEWNYAEYNCYNHLTNKK